jgi:hypothetical protein
MSKLVCSTSWHPVGCTFLDWSINYLSGQNKILNRNLGWIKLVDNPVQKINAHGHKKNHPSGFDQTVECVDFLRKQSDLVTLYPFPLSADLAAAKLGKDMSNINASDWQQIKDYSIHDYNQTLQWLSDQGADIVFVSLNKSLVVYQNIEIRSLDRLFHINHPAKTFQDVRDSLDQVFFKDSTAQWKKLNLVHSWDIRERLALDTRPFDLIVENVNLAVEHHWVDCQELWHNGTEKILEILSWLRLEVDQSRLKNWYKIYAQWQSLYLKKLSFQFNYQHIVDCVVNGWSFPINLTFDQEVVIQHCLIYQHNLNLKTWRLEKFPSNTIELHQLLEPNFHPIAKIY